MCNLVSLFRGVKRGATPQRTPKELLAIQRRAVPERLREAALAQEERAQRYKSLTAPGRVRTESEDKELLETQRLMGLYPGWKDHFIEFNTLLTDTLAEQAAEWDAKHPGSEGQDSNAASGKEKML